MKMKGKFIAVVLSLCMVFQCMLILPTVSYASYLVDETGVGYEIDDLFEYSFSNDGFYTCVITKYKQLDNSNITQIEIPKEIYGVKVVEVGKEAFKGAKHLKQIYIPDSINNIGERAFYEAIGLKSITIPGSVQTVGKEAFYKCTSLEEAYILYGVRTLGSGAFAYCTNLRTVSSSNTTETPDRQGFRGNNNLTIQANPDAPILNYAGSKITKAELPDDSPAAYEYYVDENGEVVIKRYESNRKNPIIPDEINGNPVTRLAEGSFKDSGIDSVTLPDTLRTIDPNVFIGTNLTEITIPPNVTALGENFIEYKDGLIINGSSDVVEDYANRHGLTFKSYNPGTSSYYKLQVKINGYGSITGTKGGYVKSGKVINISATPNYRYEFNGWTSEGGGTFADAKSPNTTFTMPSSNATLIANFKQKPKPRLVIENGIVTEFNAYDDLVIPPVYEGKPVTGIHANAFDSYYGHGNPSSLQIPDSLVDIPIAALNDCHNLKFIKVDSGNQKYKDIDGVLYSADGKTIVKYPSKKALTEYSISNNVTTIGQYAFRDCSKLTKINVPNTVTTIESSAFYYCTNLSEINIPEGIKSIESSTFYNCNSLNTITLPNSLTSIGNSAFYDCDSLSSIVLSNSLTNIGSYAFYSCNSLSSIVLPNGLTSISSYTFASSGLSGIDIPDSVTNIGSSAFESCNNLTQVNIKANVSSIGQYAFRGCLNLSAINVDKANPNYSDDNGVLYETKDSVKLMIYPQSKSETSYAIRTDTVLIEDGAFYDCDNLTQVNLNAPSLTTIGSSAFNNCSNLAQVDLNTPSLKTIGSSAFSDCNNITDIDIPQNVTSIGSQAFYNCAKLKNINVDEKNTSYTSNEEGVLFNHSKSDLIVYPMGREETSYSVPQSVYNINSYAFAYSKSLDNIVMPNDLTSIGYEAFSHCSNIKNIDIPRSVSSISSYAFEYCTKLESIEFPEKVKTISNYVLSGCSNLKKITIYNKNASINYSYSFSGVNKSNVTIRGYLDSTAEKYAFLASMKFEQIDEASEGLLVNEKGILYGYEGTDLDVILSSNIKQIGSDAFKNPNNSNSKVNEQITSIKFPLSVRSFEPYAFDGCTSLASLDVTRAVYDIQKGAFNGCSNLVEFKVDSSNTTYKSIGGKNGSDNGVLVNYNHTIIKEVANAYKGPENDGKFTIPSDITGIEDGAFNNCSLTELTMGNTEYIGVSSFEGAFKNIDIKINLQNVVDIDDRAFANCTGITEITLPATLERLGSDVFDGCTNLKNVYVESGNTTFLDDNGVLYVYTKATNETSITPVELILYPMGRTDNTYTILENTVGIGESAFNGAKTIKTMTIPENVSYIGDRAFNGCTMLEDLTFNNGLSKIGAFAFAGNELLREIVLPKTLQTLATGAFTNCSKLYKVTIYNDNLKFGTEGKIFDEIVNKEGQNQLTIYANEGSTSQEYVKNKNINFGPLKVNTVKESITLNATGNIDATATLTSNQAQSVMQKVYLDSVNEVELNINTVSSNVYSITTSLPKVFIESFNSVASSSDKSDVPFVLTINTSIANISLDKKAIAEIVSSATGDNVEVTIKSVDLSTLNIPAEEAQRIGNRPIVEIDIVSGRNINLNNGLATISIPTSDVLNVKVVAISNGSVAVQDSNLDSTKSYLVFYTSNLTSKYAVSKTN